MITTKKNILKVYSIPIILLLFICGLIIYLLREKSGMFAPKSDIIDEKLYTSIVAFFVMVAIVIKEFLKVLKIVPNVTVNNNQIIIGKQAYSIQDIDEVTLSGKFKYPFHSIRKMKELMFREGLEIKLKNGETIHLFEEFYYNLHEVKFGLQKALKLGESKNNSISIDKQFTIRNNQFLKPRGILTWGAIIFLVLKYLVIDQYDMNDYRAGLVLLLCIIVFFYQSLLMHYFVFDKKQLLVKNENLFWQKQGFELSEITEVVYENDSGILAVFKRKYLRIILKNHKQYRIGADLLRKKDWFQMKEEFEKINITVRVEF